jgi:hypothetical protein
MPRRRDYAVAALAALALATAAGGAQNAGADLLAGDTLHGNIGTTGDEDVLSIYLPGEAVFSARAYPDGDSALLPDLELDDPNGDPVLLDLVKEPGPGGAGVRVSKLDLGPFDGGTYAFRVIAENATTGKYVFRCTAKMPKKFVGSPTIGQEAFGGMEFDAPAGSKLRYAVKPLTPGSTFTMRSLAAPDDAETPLTSFTGSGILLDQDGTWKLNVNNDGAQPAEIAMTVTLAVPRSRRVLYLSPDGFGPAPRVRTVTPRKVLDDRPAPGIAVTGEGFDPAAVLRLEKKGEAPLQPTGFSITGSGSATADFDVTGADTGGWKLVVENPSGGAGSATLVVQKAGSVKLPPGLQAETECWWLDFDGPAFRSDLDDLGLGSSDPNVRFLAEAAVKSYVVFWLRSAFRLDPLTGKVIADTSAPVSFCLEPPPYTVGAAGTEYDRILVGGAAQGGDPSSNPNYAWGDGPYDAGNVSCDDISPDGGTGRGVKTAALVAPGAGPYHDALQPLRDIPLSAGDAQYFFTDFLPVSQAEGLRYRNIAAAVNAAGREIAGTIAHFVARAMGTADGGSGLSSVPTTPGAYFALPVFGFTQPEIDALMTPGASRPGLPGKVKTLKARWFPYREGSGYRLPDATTTQSYAFPFVIAGGRPDRVDGDLQFTGVAGAIPVGFTLLATGGLSGTSPLRNPDSTLNAGVFRFLVKLKDKVSGEVLYFSHRLNLLVDTTDPTLSPAEVFYGGQLNTQIVNAPD